MDPYDGAHALAIQGCAVVIVKDGDSLVMKWLKPHYIRSNPALMRSFYSKQKPIRAAAFVGLAHLEQA